MASPRRIGRRAGGSQDLGRGRAQPDDRASPADHDVADVRQVRRFHIHWTAADEVDRCWSGRGRAGIRALRGVCGFVGVAIATRIVDSWGAYKTSLLFTGVMLTGVIGWAVSAGIYPLMACSVAVWGLGFASTNSMQQVRLVGAAPALASASVSLNTSVLYIGQAVGSAIGGMLFARDLLHGAGYVAAAFIALALVVGIPTKPPRAAALST